MSNFTYPILSLPYDAVVKLSGVYHTLLRPFVVEGMNKDLRKRIAGPVIYYYPQYVDYLYQLATAGEDWRLFFKPFDNDLALITFMNVFEGTIDKLDKAHQDSFKRNHLSEIKIRKGKI